MIRNASFEDISDGKRYGASDLVKADCHGCEGCYSCCTGMGDSIELDPLDVHRLSIHLSQTFDQMTEHIIALHYCDGLILPGMKMVGEKEACACLTLEGRCNIHPARPGICRMFPLGRIYEDGTFHYFLQVHECSQKTRSKVKVKKWIDTPELSRYEAYIIDWHYFLKEVQEGLQKEPEVSGQVSLYLLKQFYRTPFDQTADFYGQFQLRLADSRTLLL